MCVSMKLDAFRCDVTGIAIPNYAMFLFFFFQCGASRFSWREFSHAPKVPSGAYATIAAFPGSRTSADAIYKQFAQRGASPTNDLM